MSGLCLTSSLNLLDLSTRHRLGRASLSDEGLCPSQGGAEYQCSAGIKVPKGRREEGVSLPCCASSSNSPDAVHPATRSEGEGRERSEALHL